MPKDIGKAVRFLMQSADHENEWANYQLGKLFLLGKDIAKDTGKAVGYLTKSAEQGNQFAQYILGKLYLHGKDVPKDKELAIKWLTLSAEQGNEYAKFFLDNLDKFKEPLVALCVSRMLHHMGGIFEENILFYNYSNGLKVDSKLLRKLKEKKVAQGHKRDEQIIEL